MHEFRKSYEWIFVKFIKYLCLITDNKWLQMTTFSGMLCRFSTHYRFSPTSRDKTLQTLKSIGLAGLIHDPVVSGYDIYCDLQITFEVRQQTWTLSEFWCLLITYWLTYLNSWLKLICLRLVSFTVSWTAYRVSRHVKDAGGAYEYRNHRNHRNYVRIS